MNFKDLLKSFSTKRYNYITILLVPDDARSTKVLRIKKTHLLAAFGGVIFLFAFLLSQAFIYPYFIKQMELSGTNKNELIIAKAKLTSISAELQDLRELRKKIANLFYYPQEKDKNEPSPLPLGSIFFELKIKDEFVPKGLPANGFITARFGEKAPLFKSPHTGIDIAIPSGSFVRATGSGKVIRVYFDQIMGNTVEIDHKNGYVTRYCHLQKPLVNVGSEVKRGQIIGLSGKTGRVIGAHLHYEILLNGVPVDPLSEEVGYGGEKTKK
ncbi:MAG: M23 family metallopeptidase [bacterium]